MSVAEKTKWKDWADQLRQEMMGGLTAEVTKTVSVIASETDTSKAESTLRSVRFWQAYQEGNTPNDVLARAGFEIEFEPDEKRHVQEVTLRLNKSWSRIMQRVIDRQAR